MRRSCSTEGAASLPDLEELTVQLVGQWVLVVVRGGGYGGG